MPTLIQRTYCKVYDHKYSGNCPCDKCYLEQYSDNYILKCVRQSGGYHGSLQSRQFDRAIVTQFK